VAPSGNYVFAPNPSANTVSAFASQSGVLAPVPGSPFAGCIQAGTTTNGTCNPFGAAVNSNGKVLYVANYSSTTLSQYTIDGSTGALSALTTTHTAPTAGTNPTYFVFDPNGKYLYVANLGSKTITQFSFNSDGSLAGTNNTIQVGSVPGGIALTR
jgi:6-phosphogluconolactonase (cycloisomerase 2 family)